MKTRTLIAAFAATTLAACANGGGLRTHAQRLDPDHLAAGKNLASISLSPAGWPKDDWWKSLGDPQLDRLVDIALQGQPQLRVAEARVRQVQALAGLVESSLYPQANAEFESTRQRFSKNSIYPPELAGKWNSINEVALGVGYELDFWGKNRAAVNAALDRSHAVEVDLQAARLILTTTLVRTYILLDSGYAQRDLEQQTLREREQTLELTRQRVAAEIDSQLELTQAEAAIPAARERITALEESIALIRNQIAALEGQGPGAGLDVQRPQLAAVGSVQLPSDLPAELLGRRPDVVAQRWRIEASSQDVKEAQARFYPNVSLNGFVGFQSVGLSDFVTSGSRVLGIGPAVSLPIFDGGLLRSNLGARHAEYDVAVEQYNATLIDALHDVVDQLVSLQWLQQQAQEQDEALRLSEHAYELARSRYRSELASYLQVLVAEREVLAQRRGVIELQTRQRELRLNLIRALGGGFPSTSSLGPQAGSQATVTTGAHS
jgi:NodT family efflux transporter outer membrane factor (OMF) lipoprotein